ncbi:Winged helix-turn-helix DNA-binding [Streptomyces yunnanensis]|uniref:Winged helix-turn-helix DNA-binding n=2 Tax=Streptomyces yunnanensis TaxID=156453 RepID=A0A9X8N0J2_9ACTN|nr:Winged helix-turn-helix DNA-binding [Streptomyces yunnanensis]
MREIAASVGLSLSTVAYHLKAMKERGIVTHTPQRNRTYQLLQ